MYKKPKKVRQTCTRIPLLSVSSSCIHISFNTLALCIGHPAGLLNPFPFPIEMKTLQPSTYYMDGHVNHHEQVQRRLEFINFIVGDGDMLLEEETALMVWKCLIKRPVFSFDREAGFKWFSQVCSL